MGKPDQADAPPAANAADSVTAAETDATYVLDHEAFQVELEAGQLLADMMNASASGDADVGELHAALVSTPEAALDHLDVAAQHLTHSVDLFDVPTFHSDHTGDAS